VLRTGWEGLEVDRKGSMPPWSGSWISVNILRFLGEFKKIVY